MTVKLIGTDTAGDTNGYAGYAIANQFTCAQSGAFTGIKVYCLVNSNVRVALYSDDGANGLGNLIAESASTAVTANAWSAEIAVAGGDITLGTKYWLAHQTQTARCGTEESVPPAWRQNRPRKALHHHPAATLF